MSAADAGASSALDPPLGAPRAPASFYVAAAGCLDCDDPRQPESDEHRDHDRRGAGHQAADAPREYIDAFGELIPGGAAPVTKCGDHARLSSVAPMEHLSDQEPLATPAVHDPDSIGLLCHDLR
ncbi:MAG TPA: hypothetical protein VH661_05845, partial [Candidatus Dormibacteraeota bacterium]|nr:hypothetical protein [Candidatus Dormibacteraeota bacterium]